MEKLKVEVQYRFVKDRLRKMLWDNGIEFRGLDPVSEDAGIMKKIFRVEADKDYAAYFYLREETGERGRTVRQRIEAEKFIFRKIGEKTELRTPKVFKSGPDYPSVSGWKEKS
jgi:hypothetical protein